MGNVKKMKVMGQKSDINKTLGLLWESRVAQFTSPPTTIGIILK